MYQHDIMEIHPFSIKYLLPCVAKIDQPVKRKTILPRDSRIPSQASDNTIECFSAAHLLLVYNAEHDPSLQGIGPRIPATQEDK